MARSEGADAVQRTAWYDKPHPTFSDALALVRKELWTQEQATCVHVLSKDSDRGGRIGRNTMLGLGLQSQVHTRTQRRAGRADLEEVMRESASPAQTFVTDSSANFREHSVETIRKVLDALVAQPYGPPKGSFWADFMLRIPAKSTVGALLKPFSDSFSTHLGE